MKTNTLKLAPFVMAFLSCVFLSGCGGNGTFSPAVSTGGPVVPIVVTVNPPSVTLDTSEQKQFTVTVTGTSNQSVTWSLTSSSGDNTGSITAGGLYTAPENVDIVKGARAKGHATPPGDEETQTITVTATSNADPGSSGTATITLEEG